MHTVANADLVDIWAPYEIAYSRGLTKYVAPGPPVWSG